MWISLLVAFIILFGIIVFVKLNKEKSNDQDFYTEIPEFEETSIETQKENVVEVLNGEKVNVPEDVEDKLEAVPQSISYKRFEVNGVKFEMAFVKAGTFIMGDDDSKDSWEKPAHKVTLTHDYYIGKTEVTQALWRAVMGGDVSQKIGKKHYGNTSFSVGDEYPMGALSWYDCADFIAKLNALTNCNFRFPTDAEWEFAARGGNNSNHYHFSGSNNFSEVAWYLNNSGRHAHMVATLKPNELGIYDMSGNVEEWCDDGSYSYSGDDVIDPHFVNDRKYCMYRNGSFYSDPSSIVITHRYSCYPSEGYETNGFRLALD